MQFKRLLTGIHRTLGNNSKSKLPLTLEHLDLFARRPSSLTKISSHGTSPSSRLGSSAYSDARSSRPLSGAISSSSKAKA
jgi:hypothetical protein